MWYEFKFDFCFWGEKMIRTDIFECLWLSEEVQNEDGFLVGIHVHQLKPNPQLWHLCACLIALSGVKKKHFLYKLHISFIYFFFLLFFSFLMWHMDFWGKSKKKLLRCSGHKGNYCISLISYTVLDFKKKNVFIKSITTALIQLCLFISLEGFNRWKIGSSVSNKLDKQTKNRCVEPHSKMLFIHFGQKISEINLYFYMYESALSNCCFFLL